jgi:D-alanine-D-alanine ligase-like ATP-grasp enzyme
MNGANKLIETGPMRFESGYWQGLRQPAVLCVLRLTHTSVHETHLARFDAMLSDLCAQQALETGPVLASLTHAHPLVRRLLIMGLSLLKAMGMPIVGGFAALSWGPHLAHQWVLGLPAISEKNQAPQAAIRLACALLNAFADGQNVSPDKVDAAVQKLVLKFKPLAPGEGNTMAFLTEAHAMHIPWVHIDQNVYQFGWGRRSRWLDSSFTDETTTISTRLARDKVACARVLRNAGLPVPEHLVVKSAEEAVKAAQTLGMPVVVKPVNLDGGNGVWAGLHTDTDVKYAFEETVKLSSRVMVEKFVPGNDYRIRIHKDRVIGVVIRKPAAVLGDGVHSVQALIDQLNQDRLNNSPKDDHLEQGFKPIVVDKEVHHWLHEQGSALDAVPSAGQHIRLRGAANVNIGGTTWEVSQAAHPDNLALAVRAAAALRLDLAGVDLLLTDIARSWKETGGVVCEVNAQPQFSSGDAHRQVLAHLVQKEGRIPCVALQKNRMIEAQLQDLVTDAMKKGFCVVVAETLLACQQALRRADTDAVMWLMDAHAVKGLALPVDQLDVLVHEKAPADIKGMPADVVRQWWPLNDGVTAEAVMARLTAYLLRPPSAESGVAHEHS